MTRPGIINLSQKVLTPEEEAVLKLGLKFVPCVPTDYTKLKLEALDFCRKIRLKAYFHDNVSMTSSEVTGLRNKSTFTPTQNIPKQIVAFEQVILSSIDQLEKRKTFVQRNISKKQQMAIKNLQSDESIVIKQADKGGAVVIWPIEMYLKEGRSQVTNQEWYRAIKDDPVKEIQSLLASLLKEGLEQGYVGPKEYEFLTKQFPRTPILYLVPKIHKSLHEPPGRPIVSGCDSVLEPISKYLDVFLKPFLPQVKSYIRDTMEFIKKVENVQFNCETQLMATFDVHSLYTQIPQEEALQVMELYLEGTDRPHRVPTNFLLQLAEITLKKNYFKFEDQFFYASKGDRHGMSICPRNGGPLHGAI